MVRSRGTCAVDAVGRDGENDRAWTWLRDNGGRFGLRTFWDVNGEPWHVQCNDIPAGVTAWRAAGSPDPRRVDFLVDTQAARPGRPEYRPYPENDDKPVMKLGWHGELVRYMQLVIVAEAGGRLVPDGDFGPRTDGRVKDLQAFASLAATGVVDWNGPWQFIDQLAGNPGRPPLRTGRRSSESPTDSTGCSAAIRRGGSLNACTGAATCSGCSTPLTRSRRASWPPIITSACRASPGAPPSFAPVTGRGR